MDWFDYVNSAGIIGALVSGAYQTRKLAAEARQRDSDRRTERSLELYRDLVVDGDTANAFHRLSVLLRQTGTEKYGKTTWYIVQESDFESGGLFDPAEIGMDTPFQDFYRVLWFFERAYTSMQSYLVDADTLFQTTGFHCWWWGQLLRDVTSPKATYSLRQLAPNAAAWAVMHGEYDRWVSHCMTDFDGHGPTENLLADQLARSENTTIMAKPDAGALAPFKDIVLQMALKVTGATLIKHANAKTWHEDLRPEFDISKENVE